MHDIVEFLRRHSPFDDLDDEALESLARSAEVEFFPSGTTIFRQGEGPLEHVYVVRRGMVELVDDARALDVLGEGELFGHPSMLSGLPTGFEARGGEDTLVYRLPADVVAPLLARPAGLRYVARSLRDRPRPDPTVPSANLDPAQQPVIQLVHGRPVICDPTWSVREAAVQMAEQEASAALVRLPEGDLGIVTDRDLRDRVIAGGIDADAPVTDVMNAPAFTVSPEQSGSQVMLEMLDRDIHHVPVVWPHGEVLGVLNDRDLLAAEARAPFTLRRAIEEAGSVEALGHRRTSASSAARAYEADKPPSSKSLWRDARYAVVDLETTGLDPRRDEIISFASVPINDGRVTIGGIRTAIVRPTRMPEPETIRIHGLRPVDLLGAAPLPDALDLILEALTGRVLVAHAAWVERGFLGAALKPVGLGLNKPVLDTAVLARHVLESNPGGDAEALPLSAVARRLGLPVHRPHVAEGDALTTAQLFLALATHLDEIEPQTVGSLARLSKA